MASRDEELARKLQYEESHQERQDRELAERFSRLDQMNSKRHDPFDYRSSKPNPKRDPFDYRQRPRSQSPDLNYVSFHTRTASIGGYPMSGRSRSRGFTVDDKKPQSPKHRRSQTDNGFSMFQMNKEDLELARQMQELEDCGMGRLNSERDLETDHTAELDLETDHTAELASLIADSGMKFNEISDDVLRELLGPSVSKHLQLVIEDPSTRPDARTTSRNGSNEANADEPLHANSPSIIALRSVLSGVDRADIEKRANRLAPKPSTVASRSNRSMPQESAPDRKPKASNSRVEMSPVKQKKKRGWFGKRDSLRENGVVPDETEVASLPRSTPVAIPVLNPSGGVPVVNPSGIPASIPAAIPPPPGGSLSAAAAASRIPDPIPPRPQGAAPTRIKSPHFSFRGTNVCASCGLSHGTFLKAFDRKFHPECFRCKSCGGKIDPNDQFKYTTDEEGRKFPHHRECFMSFGISCVVCDRTIPATPDGRVPFIKHPFFENEIMCIRHADEVHKRCSACQRFEPKHKPFLDLMDGNRCACPACFRTVIVDANDAQPLWNKVLLFLERKLKLPVFSDMRKIPLLIVGSDSLNDQMKQQNSIHQYSTASTTNALTLTERGRTPYGNSECPVLGVLCLTGLPSDLTAANLAHEACHVWLRLHPSYDPRLPIPEKVEEGLAQLMAFLFLSEGLEPASKTASDEGPSDAKLRQYFQFSIEREADEICGSYRQAAQAYSKIGMEDLLHHVLQYKDFPFLT